MRGVLLMACVSACVDAGGTVQAPAPIPPPQPARVAPVTAAESTKTRPEPPVPACGDRHLDSGEECDDGNVAADDGCSPKCRAETIRYQGPKGEEEACQLLAAFPFLPADVELDPAGYAKTWAWYREDDFKEIAAMCALDLHAGPTVGMCPKIHGTQPGFEIYDLTDAGLERAQWEKKRCPLPLKQRKATKLAKLKTAVFGREAESALLYFHFSRLLGNVGFIYPTTWRTLALADVVRWSGEAIRDIEKSGVARNPAGGWGRLRLIATATATSKNPRLRLGHERLLVPGRTDVAFGALAKNPRGEQRHEAFTYVGKMRLATAAGFRKTSYYKLLHGKQPVGKVLKFNPKKKKQYLADLQELTWARDFAQLVILDHLFNQRDRSGNIHELTRIHFLDDQGRLRWAKNHDGDGAVPLVRLLLKDNDEGLNWQAHPQLDSSDLVDELRHLDPIVYARMQWLAVLMRDEASAGAVKAYFVDAVHIPAATYEEVRERFLKMADGFKRRYENDDLELDLDLEAAFQTLP